MPKKEMKRIKMKELVSQFFANRTTPLQRREIDTWLKKEDHKIIYVQWLEEWENQNPEYKPDVEMHLGKFVNFMQEHQPTTQAHKIEEVTLAEAKNNYWRYAAVAAVLIFFVGLGWAFKDPFLYRQYRTSFGELKTMVLEDGSIVTLNGNSSLQVPRWNFKTHREVYLKGEANFSVTHSEEGGQFVVKTDNQFDVKVFGTEFSVLARERGSRVHLAKGKVEVGYLENKKPQRLMMKSGDVITLRRDGLPPTMTHISTEDDKSIIWEHRRFEFNATSLNEIAEMLRDTYGFHVKIESAELGEQKLLGSYTADNAEDLLQALDEMMDIEIVRERDHLIIQHRALGPDLKRGIKP